MEVVEQEPTYLVYFQGEPVKVVEIDNGRGLVVIQREDGCTFDVSADRLVIRPFNDAAVLIGDPDIAKA